MLRPRHEVSVKAAIYKKDNSAVLVMHYLRGSKAPWIYGLPGGHLEKDELPDAAMARELHEELGISISNFKKVDFFLRGGEKGSVILGYTATFPDDQELAPSDPDQEVGVWATREELQKLPNFSPEYVRMVLENWPE